MNQSPCYKCQTRTATCHATCEKYLVFEEENTRRRAEKKQIADIAYLSQNNNPYYIMTKRERRNNYGKRNGNGSR